MNRFRWILAQFFEKWWWRQYLSKKDITTYRRDKIKYWHTFLNHIEVNQPENKKVLDAGCGPAGIFCALSETNTIIGVDPLIDQYQEHFQTLVQPGSNVTLIKENLESYQSNEPFNYIFCLNAINHVQQYDLCLQRLFQNGNKETLYIFSSDVHHSYLLAGIMKWLSWLDVLHPIQMTKDEYEESFKANGFEVKQSKLCKAGLIFNYHAWVLTQK